MFFNHTEQTKGLQRKMQPDTPPSPVSTPKKPTRLWNTFYLLLFLDSCCDCLYLSMFWCIQHGICCFIPHEWKPCEWGMARLLRYSRVTRLGNQGEAVTSGCEHVLGYRCQTLSCCQVYLWMFLLTSGVRRVLIAVVFHNTCGHNWAVYCVCIWCEVKAV